MAFRPSLLSTGNISNIFLPILAKYLLSYSTHAPKTAPSRAQPVQQLISKVYRAPAKLPLPALAVDINEKEDQGIPDERKPIYPPNISLTF